MTLMRSTKRRLLAGSTPRHRLTRILDALPAHPVEDWPELIAAALARADFIRREHERFVPILQTLAARGLRIFDGHAARQAFETLPPQVTIYRGTCIGELTSREFGVCWALDEGVAGGFALRHEIARFAVRGRPDIAEQLVPGGIDTESVVLTATIDRDHIAGLLRERDEREVLVLPEHLRDVRPAPSDPAPTDLYCEDPS